LNVTIHKQFCGLRGLSPVAVPQLKEPDQEGGPRP
jgi:hypothetical protein